MAATTFFGNRATCKLLNTWTAVPAVTLTNASTAFTCAGTSAGDYVWLTADGIQHACRVAAGGGSLAYNYLGAGGAGAGYRCTPETMQVLRGLECTISWEVSELYGTDSIFRVDEAKHNLKVETKAKYSKWDAGVTVDWQMKVLHPVTTADGTIGQTNVCFVNAVVYTITGSLATSHIEMVCGKTYWDNVPYPFPENDFVVKDVTGHAKSATLHDY